MGEYKVGDEVIIAGRRYVVTRCIEGSLLYVMGSKGVTSSYSPKVIENGYVVKTGRTFPQILDVLSELEEPVK